MAFLKKNNKCINLDNSFRNHRAWGQCHENTSALSLCPKETEPPLSWVLISATQSKGARKGLVALASRSHPALQSSQPQGDTWLRTRGHPSPVPLLHLTNGNRAPRKIISARPSDEPLTQHSGRSSGSQVSVFVFVTPHPLCFSLISIACSRAAQRIYNAVKVPLSTLL